VRERVGGWLAAATPGSGKPTRLLELRRLLAFDDEELDRVRYQLLHRAVSASKEGVRLSAKFAALYPIDCRDCRLASIILL
jgi:Domain of unknown function (DUF6946)